MKSSDHLLDRLLKAAAAVPSPQVSEPSFALERRTLAAWRHSNSGADSLALVRFLRIGLGFALVVMVAIVALSWLEIAKEPRVEFAMPNVMVNLALSE